MAFSCLRQIHSWLRTTTTRERLGKLVVLALHGFDIPVNVDRICNSTNPRGLYDFHIHIIFLLCSRQNKHNDGKTQAHTNFIKGGEV